MDPFENIEVFDCPVCHGTGMIQEENGWCLYVECMDCACHTAELPYHSPEERIRVAQQVVSLWNVGEVIVSGVGD